jgi:hypothetical protein
MHYVTNVEYAGDYKLLIQFEDNAPRIVDLANHLDGPIFEPLKDLDYFHLFRLNSDIDTVVWPNNADFSPDFLYSISVAVQEPAAIGE